MPGGVRIIDRGWNAFKKKLQRNKGKGLVASVGVQGDKATEMHEGGDITNATIGAIQEYGTEDGRVPERSHWRATFDENESKYTRELEKIPGRLLQGQSTIKGELLLVGEIYKFDVLKKIKSHIAPALAESTIEMHKGETTPLDNTGQYINSFSVDVVPRSEKSDA